MIRNYTFVEYINNEGRLTNNTNNITQAIVSIANIWTKPNGKHEIVEQICNLYVGKPISIEQAIDNDIIPKNMINECKKNGTKQIVVNNAGIHPLNPYDEVFEDETSMLEALNKQIERLSALGYQNDDTIKKTTYTKKRKK